MKLFLLVVVCSVSATILGENYVPTLSAYQDDLHYRTTHVVISSAVINSTGNIQLKVNKSSEILQEWKKDKKTILLALSAHQLTWKSLVTDKNVSANFFLNLREVLQDESFGGIDLTIDSFQTSPFLLGQFLSLLKRKINGFYLSLTLQPTMVYAGQSVPTPETWNSNNSWNYVVPILKQNGQFFDFFHVKAYGKWYDSLPGGSVEYLKDITLQWMNLPSPYCQKCEIIANFTGIEPSKLFLGLLGSKQAGAWFYYADSSVIIEFQQWLREQKLQIGGFIIENSFHDSFNGYKVSASVNASNCSQDILLVGSVTAKTKEKQNNMILKS